MPYSFSVVLRVDDDFFMLCNVPHNALNDINQSLAVKCAYLRQLYCAYSVIMFQYFQEKCVEFTMIMKKMFFINKIGDRKICCIQSSPITLGWVTLSSFLY